jgi:hypothetical protein
MDDVWRAIMTTSTTTRIAASAASLAIVMTLCGFAPSRAYAHHSGSEYDRGNIIEVEGTLLEVAWQNPHVHFTARSKDDDHGSRHLHRADRAETIVGLAARRDSQAL